MEKVLAECCEMMLKLLDRLLAEGKITKEEYERQIELKIKFLSMAPG